MLGRLRFKRELLSFIVSLEYNVDISCDLYKLSLPYNSLLSYRFFINMQNSFIRLSAMIAHHFGIERAPTQSIKCLVLELSMELLISVLTSLKGGYKLLES